MRKIFYSMLAMGSMLSMVSCSADDPTLNGGDGNVSITLTLPGGNTRAIGDTLDCNELIYTVYDSTGKTVIIDDQKIDAFGLNVNTTKVNLKLVPTESYKVAFYAHNKSSQFSSYKQGKISVDYQYLNPNQEIDDAFYGVLPITVTEGSDLSVTLNRAFAQINIGTSDLTNGAVQDVIDKLEASLYYPGTQGTLNNTLDVFTDEVSVNEDNITNLSFVNKLKINNVFPTPGFGNLSSFYMLAPKTKAIISLNYQIIKPSVVGEGDDAHVNVTTVRDFSWGEVPIQMNYRTNICGAMITTDIPVTVNLEPRFDDSYEPWIGAVTKPAIDDENKTITIGSASDLAGLAELINSGNSFPEYVATLQGDVDLNNIPFTPIGNANRDDKGSTVGFAGTFDGGNHVISNLNVSTTGKGNASGLFGVMRSGTVKNVTVSKATVTSDDSAGGIVGVLLGDASIENCTVTADVTITTGSAGGGIAARAYGTSNQITGCNNYATVSGTGNGTGQKIGGIVGIAATGANTYTFTNCNNYGEIYGGADGVGGICGYTGSPTTLTGCTNSGNVGKSSDRYVGGIVGYNQATAGITITNCENTGDITGNYAGGIFGALGNSQPTNISGCNNSGNINANTLAGGISAYLRSGTMENCRNTGAVKASEGAGGVVGQIATATLKDCYGGAAAIEAPIAGRQIGIVSTGNDPKMAYIYLPTDGTSETDSYENINLTIGSFGGASLTTAIANATIYTGVLMGIPDCQTGSNCKIIIVSPASWNEHPGETGTWMRNKNQESWNK